MALALKLWLLLPSGWNGSHVLAAGWSVLQDPGTTVPVVDSSSARPGGLYTSRLSPSLLSQLCRDVVASTALVVLWGFSMSGNSNTLHRFARMPNAFSDMRLHLDSLTQMQIWYGDSWILFDSGFGAHAWYLSQHIFIIVMDRGWCTRCLLPEPTGRPENYEQMQQLRCEWSRTFIDCKKP